MSRPPSPTPPSTPGLVRTHSNRPSLSHLLSTSLFQSSQSFPDAVVPIHLPDAPALSSELFLTDKFDVSAFLTERRHTPLDELRDELKSYLASLRQNLTSVINDEYESFIGLSLGLRRASVASSLSSLLSPILYLHEEIDQVRLGLDEMRGKMERLLKERKKVREKKATLRRLLECEDMVEKVEGLLRLGKGGASGEEREVERIVDSPARRLERISGEYSQMLYLISKAGPQIPFIESLSPRTTRITTTLHLDLSQHLTSVLLSLSPPSSAQLSPPSSLTAKETLKARESLTVLFRIYASLNLIPLAEDLVRRTLVRPFVLGCIYRDVLSSGTNVASLVEDRVPRTPATGVSAGFFSAGSGADGFYSIEPIRWKEEIAEQGKEDAPDEPLVELLNALLRFVENHLAIVLDVTERNLASKMLVVEDLSVEKDKEGKRARYEVLTRVVWDEIATRLMGELGSVIFAAGRPGVFHRNYLLLTTFVTRLESLCPTLSLLNTFRTYPTTQTFLKRFQIPVYFQLRLKDIITSVERALEGGAGGGGQNFCLAETEAVWRAIEFAWSRDVWLNELGARFWGVTLQLMSRYRNWVISVIPKGLLTPNLLAILPAPARGQSGQSSPSSPGGTRPGTPSSGADDLSEEATLRRVTILVADMRMLESKMVIFFQERIRILLVQGTTPAMAEGVEEIAIEALQESLTSLTSLIPLLSNSVIQLLTKRCSEHLKLVKSVASQVRASTRKGAPSEPSYFIGNILKDLKLYLGGLGKVLGERERREWTRVVVEEVASRYAAILASQKKTEDGLRRLKKSRQGLSFFGRATTSADDTAVEDSRVQMQMQVDIDALGREATALGVEIDGMEGWEALRVAIVDSAEK